MLESIDADLIDDERLAASVVDEIIINERRRPEKRKTLTDREALKALRFEAQLCAVAMQNIACGIQLTERDQARLIVGWHLIERICDHVGAYADR